MTDRKWQEAVEVGFEETFSKTVSEADVYMFAGVTGDFYGIHVNEEFAKTTRFKTRIVHGALLVGFVSTVMARINGHFPPPGGVSYRYDVKFTAPVYFGDTVTTRLRVAEINPDRSEVILSASCENQHGEIVLRGQTILKMLRDVQAQA